MIRPDYPAIALAPMDGITDAPMRELQGEFGAFTYAVSEFVRVSATPAPAHVFARTAPELASGAITRTGLPVQIQILGGDPERMALSAVNACKAGANSIDINFGCPAPTVNRHDGGASLLKHPCRIREIVAAVRAAVPPAVPVSAKLRLGWDSIEPAMENAAMAAEGGAAWLTLHARTRSQNYSPPVYWPAIGKVGRSLGIPVVANGDIWDIDDFRRCRDETGCNHFMLGRGALANPGLSFQIARELGILDRRRPFELRCLADWVPLLGSLVRYTEAHFGVSPSMTVKRLKQWLRIAATHGSFPFFDEIKRADSASELLEELAELTNEPALAASPNRRYSWVMRPEVLRVGAYALIVDDGRILLCRLSTGKSAGMWTLPGGGIEFGESPAEAAVREVLEETGYDVEIDQLVDVTSHVDESEDRRLQNLHVIYTARITGGELRQEVDGSTDEAAWHGHRAAERLPLVGLAAHGIRLAFPTTP